MSNGNGNGYTAGHTHPAVQIGRDVLQFLTMVFVFYTASIGSRTSDRVETVEQRQTETLAKQQEAANKTERVKVRLDERAEEDVKSMGIQLYSSWKYLEDVANASGLPRDVGKAAEAKKVYEDHLKKYGAKLAAPKVENE